MQKLSYIQILDLADMAVPSSPRERNALNILAHLPSLQPIQNCLGVFDLSQGMNRITMRTDGCLGTDATNSHFWSMVDGMFLTGFQVGELMGHRMAEIDLAGISETALRKMMGNSVHVAVIGLAEIGMIASMARDGSE